MHRSRPVLAGMLLLVLVALAVPAVSFAGGSAGDQQYTDPFGGGGNSGGSASHSASTTTSSPAPAPSTSTAAPSTTPAASGAPSSTPAASTGSADPTTSAAVSTTAGEPTATIANGSSTTLPYTGYDAWTAVGFGVTLVAGGAVLRWRLRTRRT